MRIAYFALGLAGAFGLLGACSVPSKQSPADGGVGSDGGGPPVDTSAPDTTIDDGPPDFSNSGQVTFRFSSNEPSATFMCRIDKEAPVACTSPYVRTLADGQHTFSVKAIDSSGNSDDTPAERVWTIDTVPPTTTLTAGPPAADNSVMATFSFTSNEMNVTFSCSLDNAGYLPCMSGGSFGPVGDGPHSFAVRAQDRAGNIDPSPAVYAWTVNTSTPDTQILSGPPAASAVTTASFTFFSPDAGGGATFTCSLDGAAFTACTSPQSYSGLGQGSHQFQVRVRDAVGNMDPTPATETWVVDLTPPVTSITSGPTGTVAVASAAITFTANEANATFGCSLDGAPFTACTSPAALTGLAQGPHTFAVRATDAAGNTDPTPATQTWTVDTVAPDIAITAGPAAASTSGPRVTFSFTTSEGAPTCSFDGAAFTACASPLAINLPAAGHTLSIRATDAAGNVTTVMRAWTVACAAPDPTGAAGLLHLDDTGQTLANAVAGGAPATLGDTVAVEPDDPSPIAAGRFGGALQFTAASGDRVSWPIGLPAMPALTVELWSRPTAAAGSHDVLTSGDGRVALRVVAASPSTVQYSISIDQGGMTGVVTVTSAAVAAGAWHHVLASLQQPSLRLWVDGVRTESDTVQLATPPALDALSLGGGAVNAYDGAIDEVWLAQTAITSDDAALQRYCPL